MKGFYESFPINIHLVQTYHFEISRRKIQQKIIQELQKINCEELTFEKVANPTVPDCTVILEFGIANDRGFNFLNQEESRKLIDELALKTMQVIDWFCCIRYYKNMDKKKQPLKFDYYMLRLDFSEKEEMTALVFHERGPRYISPENIVSFIQGRINQKRKILTHVDKA